MTANDVSYSVTFENQSQNTGAVCLYQQDPNITDPDVMALAWFSKGANPGTSIQFEWQIEYDFVWDQTGILQPTTVFFVASQVWVADLTTENTVTLTKNAEGYLFQNLTFSGVSGTLYINEDNNIAADDVSVGIGMSGVGTFVRQGGPNWHLNFTPHPEYWITFGDYEQGQVLDISSISDKAQIIFPDNKYKMQAILQANDTWKIESID